MQKLVKSSNALAIKAKWISAKDLGVDGKELFVTATSASTVYKDLLLVGTSVSEAWMQRPDISVPIM